MVRQVIGICGVIGSGKDTVARYLVEQQQFTQLSFAGTLKDVCSAIFGWDREMMEGATPESRKWRNQVDQWWADRLEIPGFTPRWAMQHIGTDVMREHFSDEIWVASVERQMSQFDGNIVISDCRFPNEIAAIYRAGGRVLHVVRTLPAWFEQAKIATMSTDAAAQIAAERYLLDEGIHESEWAWASTRFDEVVQNTSTIEELYSKIDTIIECSKK